MLLKSETYNHLLFLFVTVLLFSCGTSKKVVNQPVTETVVIEEVEVEKVDSIIPIEIISEEQNVVENDTIYEVEVVEENEEETGTIHDQRIDHSKWTELLKKHVSDKGNVNYKGFKSDYTLLKLYLNSLSEKIPDDTWSKPEKLAYWINAYNAFTIKLIVDRYPIKSIKDIENAWDFRFIKLEKKWYTLNDIEHKILRKMNEPSIHFAIVCASVSCPKLQNEAFFGPTMKQQLDEATTEFLIDSSKNEISENTIKLSKIFKWFSKDFKKDGSIIDFLNKYSEITISQNAKKSYKAYNWDLNE